MAKIDSATIEPGTNEDTATVNTRVVKDYSNMPDDVKVPVMVQMPNGLKKLVDAASKSANVSTAGFIRNLLAGQYNYTLPEDARGRRAIYQTDADKKAAAKAASKKRTELIRTAMKLKNSDPELYAKLFGAVESADTEDSDGDTDTED